LKSNFRYWIASFPPSPASKLIQIQFLHGPGVPIQLMTHWWVTEALGLELASARLTILLILRRKPGRKCGTDHPESRLRSQLLTHLLLQLLRKVPGEVLFPPIQQVGLTRILHCAGFIFFDFNHRTRPRGISFQTPL
jgi:hypothetical protein